MASSLKEQFQLSTLGLQRWLASGRNQSVRLEELIELGHYCLKITADIALTTVALNFGCLDTEKSQCISQNMSVIVAILLCD